jgi:membrane-anchored mycosin MYCP
MGTSTSIPTSSSSVLAGTGDPASAGSAELVVATGHWPGVRAELAALAQVADVCDALGLTRVTLPDVARAAALFEQELRGPVVLPGQNSILMPQTPLDQVLAGLRVRFARRHCGWMPTLGKNRELVDGVGNPIMIAREVPGGLPVPVSRPAGDAGVAPTAGDGRRIGVLDTSVFVPNGERPADLGLVGLDAGDRLRPVSGQLLPFWKGHGTFVAGLIHRHAPAAQIVLRAVLTGELATAYSWDVATALVAMADLDLDVINLSLACVTTDNQPPLVLAAAVAAVSRRSVVVAAAGNYGATDGPRKNTPPAWPAALDDVLAVGSTRADGSRSSFSPDEPWVGPAVQGEDLVSSYLSGKVGGLDGAVLDSFSGYARWSGTSFSAAVVSGRLAALAGELGGTARDAVTSL